MPRLVNGERKITNPRPENAGKLLIFCEGHTEYNYLDYFRSYIDNNLRAKYSDIVIEPINAEGNAMHVYNYAEEFLGTDENASKYLHYEKHLVFDCDAPENIQEVISLFEESVKKYMTEDEETNDYGILVAEDFTYLRNLEGTERILEMEEL